MKLQDIPDAVSVKVYYCESAETSNFSPVYLNFVNYNSE